MATLAARLKELFPDASGVSRKDWLARGRVTVNGAVVRDGRAVVADGDRVRLGAETVARVTLSHPLRLVHEDDQLLVIEKPADLLTIATESGQERTAYRLVFAYLQSKRPPVRPLIVHRLDRQTSGLLVLAKSTAVKRDLQSQFAARTVTRGYVAVVEGRVASDAGTLEDRIVQNSALHVRRAGPGEEGARLAVTRYRVRERGPTTTVLDVTLGTGRRHQIRVQLAALGHPVVGDRAYHAATDPVRRLCLHATTLGFVHPATGAVVRFESPVPPAVGRLRRASASRIGSSMPRTRAASRWQTRRRYASATGVAELSVIVPVRGTAPGFVTAGLVVRVAATVLVIAAIVALVRSAGDEIPLFAAWVNAQGAWAPLAYVAGYAVLTLVFVPGALPTMAAGVVFGLGSGTVYAFLGEVLGGVAAFWLARALARPWIEPRLARSPRFATLDRTVAVEGRRIVAMLRLSPAIPFNVLNYALGLSTIRFSDYVLASCAMLPGAFLYVYYGKLIGDVAALAAGTPVPHDAVYWTATLLGLGATIALSIVLARVATRALREAHLDPESAPISPADVLEG